MDSNSDEGDYQDALPQDMVQDKVSCSHGRNTKEVDYDKKEEFNKKRYPVGRSGNTSCRVRRVVSCKRKTHHLTAARRKQSVSGRTYDMANKENEMNCMQDMQQEIFYMDPWEFLPHVNNNHNTGRTSSKNTDYSTLTEVRNIISVQTLFLFSVWCCVMIYCGTNMHVRVSQPKNAFQLSGDHGAMTNVLFGRNLRLKVASTLWHRNVEEMLTYFLRIQDTGVFVDFLPLITKSINEDSPSITIGCCVDLFPLVKKVLNNPYEEYLLVGLKWIHSVLKNWWEELGASGYSGSTNHPLNKNFQVFNQQLLELWHREPLLKSVPGTAGDLAKVIDSFLSQLT